MFFAISQKKKKKKKKKNQHFGQIWYQKWILWFISSPEMYTFIYITVIIKLQRSIFFTIFGLTLTLKGSSLTLIQTSWTFFSSFNMTYFWSYSYCLLLQLFSRKSTSQGLFYYTLFLKKKRKKERKKRNKLHMEMKWPEYSQEGGMWCTIKCRKIYFILIYQRAILHLLCALLIESH